MDGATPDVMVNWVEENIDVINKRCNQKEERTQRNKCTNTLTTTWKEIVALNTIKAETMQKIIAKRTMDTKEART